MTKHRRFTFQFTRSDRDAVIAAWIDSARDDPNVNISEIIKNNLYNVAMGRTDDPTLQAIRETIAAEFAKLPPMMMRVSTDAGRIAEPDEADEIARKLGAMPS
jgi:hypothetical protein